MRLTMQQRESIKQLIVDMIGDDANIIVFGSRVDDNKRGGDLDLMIEWSHAIDNPAWLAAKISAKVSRLMAGRRVDVLILAPNLARLPIHDQAKLTGVQL